MDTIKDENDLDTPGIKSLTYAFDEMDSNLSLTELKQMPLDQMEKAILDLSNKFDNEADRDAIQLLMRIIHSRDDIPSSSYKALLRNILRTFDKSLNKNSELKIALTDKNIDMDNIQSKMEEVQRKLEDLKIDVRKI